VRITLLGFDRNDLKDTNQIGLNSFWPTQIGIQSVETSPVGTELPDVQRKRFTAALLGTEVPLSDSLILHLPLLSLQVALDRSVRQMPKLRAYCRDARSTCVDVKLE